MKRAEVTSRRGRQRRRVDSLLSQSKAAQDAGWAQTSSRRVSFVPVTRNVHMLRPRRNALGDVSLTGGTNMGVADS